MPTAIKSLSVTFLTRSRSAKEFVLGPGHYLIGSDHGCDITLSGETVDPEHCILTWDGERLFVEDLMSASGVAVNSRRVTLAEITSRDVVRVGNEFIFSFQRSPNETGKPPTPENMVVEVFADVEPPVRTAAKVSRPGGGVDDPGATVPIAGEVTESSLPDALERIAQSRRAGTLYVRSQSRKVAIHFRQGKAVYATPSLPRDKIGEILLARNLITPVDLYDALKEQKKLRRKGEFLRLGTLLVSMGCLKAAELKDCISEQIGEALNDIMTETQGDFSFEPYTELQRDDVVSEVDVGEILNRVREIRRAASAGRDVPLPHDVFEINGDPTAVKNINLGLNEWKILSLIDGERDTVALARSAKFPVITIISVLIRLSEIDLVRKTEAHSKRPSPKARKGFLKRITADKRILKRLLGKFRARSARA